MMSDMQLLENVSSRFAKTTMDEVREDRRAAGIR